MKDKQKSLEIAMEYQIQRDQEINRYIQKRQSKPLEDASEIGRRVWRFQTLFEGWADLSNVLNGKGGHK